MAIVQTSVVQMLVVQTSVAKKTVRPKQSRHQVAKSVSLEPLRLFKKLQTLVQSSNPLYNPPLRIWINKTKYFRLRQSQKETEKLRKWWFISLQFYPSESGLTVLIIKIYCHFPWQLNVFWEKLEHNWKKWEVEMSSPSSKSSPPPPWPNPKHKEVLNPVQLGVGVTLILQDYYRLWLPHYRLWLLDYTGSWLKNDIKYDFTVTPFWDQKIC